MARTPIVLVPGFWLGAWAWDEVAAALRADGHDVTALTLPGLESVDADRSTVTLEDHVEAICEVVRQAGSPVVLAVHSGTGFSGYAATDRTADLIVHMVYVDSAPGKGANDPDFTHVDRPLPPLEELRKSENLDGLTDEQLDTFYRRAVPEPGAAFRESIELTNDARRDIPTTMICTGYSSDEYKAAVADGDPWLAGVPELTNISWVDLPTSHWPMWSRPTELARIIGDIAKAVVPR
jgi:pimeloyl-ACP methyl ester carboxylesterase